MVSVGTIVWLSSGADVLRGLFAMYFTVRAAHPDDWPTSTDRARTSRTRWSSRSSWSCRRSPASSACSPPSAGDVYGLRRWFTLTFVMGLIFVLGQANEYRILIDEGTTHLADGLRLGLLHHHRLPRDARDRRPDRLHLPAGPLDPGPVHAGTGDRARSSCPTTGTSSTWCGSGCSRRST